MNAASQPRRRMAGASAEERACTFQAKPVWQRFLIVAGRAGDQFPRRHPHPERLQPRLRRAPDPAGDRRASGTARRREQAGFGPATGSSGSTARVERFEDIGRSSLSRPEGRSARDRKGGEAPPGRRQPRMIRGDRPVRQRTRRPVLGIEPADPGAAPVRSVRRGRRLGPPMLGRRQHHSQGARPDRHRPPLVKELGGPLKIAKFSGEQASMGLLHFLWFVAVISINLGFINLLPIPMLDGGHLFFYGSRPSAGNPCGRRHRNGRSGPAWLPFSR
jgi:regulator of sigma E protease